MVVMVVPVEEHGMAPEVLIAVMAQLVILAIWHSW